MSQYLKYNDQNIAVGDTVAVHQQIVEGSKKRVQIFEGIIIAIKGRDNGKSITIRKIGTNNGEIKTNPIKHPLNQAGHSLNPIQKIKSLYLNTYRKCSFLPSKPPTTQIRLITSKLFKFCLPFYYRVSNICLSQVF